MISPYFMWTNSDGTTQIISIDTLEEETPTYSSLITKYPIQKGSDITDHTQQENTKLSITVIFVDFPLTVGGGGKDEHPEELEKVGSEARAIRLFASLDSLRKNSTLLTFRSERLRMQDLLIKSQTYTQTKTSGNGIRCKMQLEQQTFVESKRVKTKRPKTGDGQACKPIGDKTSSTAPVPKVLAATYFEQWYTGKISTNDTVHFMSSGLFLRGTPK